MQIYYKILYCLKRNKIYRLKVDYILHVKYFFYSKLFLFYPLLVPRNDTCIVFPIFQLLFSEYFSLVIMDFGCGTGTFITSVYFYLKKNQVVSIDQNYLAICLTKINFSVSKKYIFECWWIFIFLGFKKFNIIFSNPPYLSFYDLSYDLNLKLFESKMALLSFQFGYSDIYDILNNVYSILSLNGYLLLEHSYFQSKNIRCAMKKCGFVNIYTSYDLNSLSRITCAEK